MGTDAESWAGTAIGGEMEEPGFRMERDLLCTANSEGYFTSLNGGWERLLGWTREELMSRPFVDFVHPNDREQTVRRAARVTSADHELVDFENRYRAKGGTWRWLRWSARSDGETWFAVAFDVTEEKETEQRLRAVLTDDHLIAYTQPIVDGLGSVTQEELLVRMRGPNGDGTVLAPDTFLPDAERTGLIGLVDRWMVDQGVALASVGRRPEVNLSARSMGDVDLTTELAEGLREAGAKASSLIFEITETAAVEHLDTALDFAERVGRLGCRFALDDFGTGFGSLTYLRHLPVQYLKIDSSFILNLTEDAEDQAMVRAIVAMAKELGVLTVAEGVEDETTLGMLRGFGVDLLQGYHIGRPAPLAA
jgi:PAS domain S-box-containing protein